MVNYNNSVIYKICCKDASVEDFYIGSTTNFTRRKSEHKKYVFCQTDKMKKDCQAVHHFIRLNGGWDNWDMIEVKKFPCNDKRELHAEEYRTIRELNSTLNKQKYSDDEIGLWWIEYRKTKTYLDSKHRRDKEYYDRNADKLKEKSRQYREENKEMVYEKAKQKVTCECGCLIRKSDISAHRKSKKHQSLMNTLN